MKFMSLRKGNVPRYMKPNHQNNHCPQSNAHSSPSLQIYCHAQAHARRMPFIFFAGTTGNTEFRSAIPWPAAICRVMTMHNVFDAGKLASLHLTNPRSVIGDVPTVPASYQLEALGPVSYARHNISCAQNELIYKFVHHKLRDRGASVLYRGAAVCPIADKRGLSIQVDESLALGQATSWCCRGC
jgi:hypothetical protein